MTHLRRVLAPLTAIWLSCQIGTVAFVPIAVLIAAANPHAATCTCGHGPGGMCSMHHKPTGGSAPCAMQAANPSGTVVLTSVVGVAGLISEPALSFRPALPSVPLRAADVHVVGQRPVPPDPPPPRA